MAGRTSILHCRAVDLDGDEKPELCGVNKSGKLFALPIEDEELDIPAFLKKRTF